MSFLDEVEHGKLEEKIRQIEILLAHGTAEGGSVTASALAAALEVAKKRVETLETEQKLTGGEKEKKSVSELVVIYHVQKETALSPLEREQYRSFLELDYFTRDDFDRLAGFYTNSWDRLTEDGKAQMSHRVWEGIRHGEFSFGQLPEQVQGKEAGRIYQQLSGKGGDDLKTHAIPAKDREDFIRAFETGNKAQAAEVLKRESFTENISNTAVPTAKASQSREKDQHGQETEQAQKPKEVQAAEDLSLSGLTLANAQSAERPNIHTIPKSGANLERS